MERASIEDLYQRYGPAVFRRARTLLRDEQAAWDAVQEVFVRAMHKGAFFRSDAAPTTWLYRITTNYCLNLLRDSGRRQVMLREYARTAPLAGDERCEVPVMVREILGRLPTELCEIAVYCHVDRMSHDEIAAVVGLSPRTIRNRLKEFQLRAQAILGFSLEVAI
jgi:RNA polymerase sigma-70 factor (ECF subfamily)